MKQQKDEAQFVFQDKKKQLIYDKEEIVILTMQNNEFRKKIGQLQKEHSKAKNERTRM